MEALRLPLWNHTIIALTHEFLQSQVEVTIIMHRQDSAVLFPVLKQQNQHKGSPNLGGGEHELTLDELFLAMR